MSVPARVIGLIEARALMLEGDRVLVALSGGVDSVVLLHVLHTHAQELGIELHAAHFDHAMRAGSAADAAWVGELCNAWSIPFVTARTTRALRSENDARIERYRFLTDTMKLVAADAVATAHHADDQAETVLMRLLRGSGLRGLAGIPVRRGAFVRPLLRVTKAELLAYAQASGLSWRPDPTNDSRAFLRNRVRHDALPALTQITPDTRSALLLLARHAARTEEAWQTVVREALQSIVLSRDASRIELARDLLLEYDPPLRKRVLRRILRRFGVLIGRTTTSHVAQFCENAESGSALEVSGRLRIERAFDRFIVRRIAAEDASAAILRLTQKDGMGRLNLGGAWYDVEWSVGEARSDQEQFPGDLIDKGLEFRAWRPGDRIRLDYGTKKLKKLFAEQRIAASDRARIPVLSDDSGRILWVSGIARSVDVAGPGSLDTLNIMVKHGLG